MQVQYRYQNVPFGQKSKTVEIPVRGGALGAGYWARICTRPVFVESVNSPCPS